jgi:hypothetical protein
VALDEKFAEAWVNADHRVLGRDLRPYSLWHQLVLQVIESPFLNGDGNLRDLDQASYVCSTHYGQPLDLRHRHPLAIWWNVRRNFNTERAEFLAYLDDYVQVPEFTIVDDSPVGPSRTLLGQPPVILSLACKVIRWSGWTEQYVWDMPIGKVEWYAAMADRQEGVRVSFKTPESNEFLNELKAKYGKRP